MGNVATAVLTALLVIVVVIAVKSYSKKLVSGCCGGGDVPKPRRVDKNPDHYSPVSYTHLDKMKGCYKDLVRALGAKYQIPIYKHQKLRTPAELEWTK